MTAKGDRKSIEEHREQFWAQVEKTPSCWWWRGRQDSTYGRYTIWRKDYTTHVAVFLLDGIEVPKGMVVMHHCDNGLCVRPDHLEIATQLANRRDCAAKGRTAIGEDNGVIRKFTPDEIRSIRERYGNPGPRKWGKVSQKQLAEEYGVHSPTIHAIVTRKAYAWVD